MNSQDKNLRGPRVLIIEDEWMVATIIEDMVGEIGCEVAGVLSDFNDTLSRVRSLRFDVAILDVNLGRRNTFPIAEVLIASGRSFVFATGYGQATIPPSLQGAPILQKPFNRQDLEQALRMALT